MKWLIGRGPVVDPQAPDDVTLPQRERLRLLAYYQGNVPPALIAWTHHTRFQFGRYLRETGRIGGGDR